MTWCLFWALLLSIELTGIIGAAIGLKKDKDRLFLLCLLVMHAPAYISLIYLP